MQIFIHISISCMQMSRFHNLKRHTVRHFTFCCYLRLGLCSARQCHLGANSVTLKRHCPAFPEPNLLPRTARSTTKALRTSIARDFQDLWYQQSQRHCPQHRRLRQQPCPHLHLPHRLPQPLSEAHLPFDAPPAQHALNHNSKPRVAQRLSPLVQPKRLHNNPSPTQTKAPPDCPTGVAYARAL